MKKFNLCICILCTCMAIGCEKEAPSTSVPDQAPAVSVKELARVLAGANLQKEQLREVHDAVSGSIDNGYDAEYTLKNIFEIPGGAVGEEYIKDEFKSTSDTKSYARPLREILYNYYGVTKADVQRAEEANKCIDYLKSSDYQIYWPYYDKWDGESTPIIAFEPDFDQDTIVGYMLSGDGSVVEVEVDEAMTEQRPVWVVNHNEDCEHVSLDVYRKNHPEIGDGGNIHIGPSAAAAPLKTLIMKDFTMKRQYDPWWRGGSEFMIRIGAVEDFTASTEAELKLFNPSVTEFMVECPRWDVGKRKEINSIMVSGWTTQLDRIAFMITEDDGGSRTTWSCSAVVKIASKSYGFEISLPFNSHDDIVWRGQISRRYFETDGEVYGSFGELGITFTII